MNHKKIWAYLLHLNENMWGMGEYDSKTNLPLSEKEKYDRIEKIAIDWKKYDELIRFLPKQGINTVLVDVGNGVQFERHPEISQKEALTKDALKAMLDGIRSLGMTPIPKLNFSCGHDSWLRDYSRRIGTEEYYTACIDCLDEVAELFGYPEYFHLGMDEENFANQGTYAFQTTRAPYLWWRDLYKLFDRCEHHNMRPWVWGDDYWNRPEEYKKNMPKSVLQSNWYYAPCRGKGKDGKYTQTGYQTYLDFEALGYDQVPTCSTWDVETNTDATFRLCKEELSEEHFKGILTAPWFQIQNEDFYRMMQDALTFGIAKKKYFPEE